MGKPDKYGNVHRVGGGTGPMFWLFLLFLDLKLTGFIAWSWWWVTAPLWGPIVVLLGVGGSLLGVAVICLLSIFIVEKISG